MNSKDKPRTIKNVVTIGSNRLQLLWSDGVTVAVNLSEILSDPAFSLLNNPAAFAKVQIGDWGHSVEWPCGVELGADTLWLETLSAIQRDDVRQFLEWRLRHSLSLAKAGGALGISRRTVAYYSNGEKKIPKPILLACTGWEVGMGLHKAA